ncbi:MAG: glycosyltransferase [Firmicutes bacterium]|nr:glycosyltransferase [Bacillota bacterium]
MYNPINLSIIIPFYNVQKYIAQCIQSVIAQKDEDIEVLLIDDCGQDNSSQIVEQFAQKDKRIRIIGYDQNIGAGGARNVGLKEALGKYIWFVDSDDKIQDGCLSKIICILQQLEVDVFLFDSLRIYENYGYNSLFYYMGDKSTLDCRVVDSPFGNDILVFDSKEQIDILLKQIAPEFGGATTLIFRKEFLIKNNLKFVQRILYEDIVVFLWLTLCTKIVYYKDEPYYHYRIRTNSIMTQKIIDNMYINNVHMSKCCLDFVKQHNSPIANYIALCRIFAMIFSRQAIFLRVEKVEIKCSIQQALDIINIAKLELVYTQDIVYNALIVAKFGHSQAKKFCSVFCNTNITNCQLQKAMLRKMKQDKLRDNIKGMMPKRVIKFLKQRRDKL